MSHLTTNYCGDNDSLHGDENYHSHSPICVCDDCDQSYYQAADLDYDFDEEIN